MIDLSGEYVADTMAIVLWIEKRKLPSKVSDIFKQLHNNDARVLIWISAISLAEIAYLSEKGRIDISLDDVKTMLNAFSKLKIADLTNSIVQRSFEITDIPELHDRLIAGTAFTLNCQLLTNDPKIVESAFVDTIWN